MRDIVNNIGAVLVVSPQVVAGGITSAAFDLSKYDSAALVVTTGAIVAAGDFAIKLQHSDSTTAGTFVDVPATQIVGSLPASLPADSAIKVGYVGWNRYLRAVITKTGGTSIALGAVLIKGNARSYPVA